jgi:hypothetical protein
MKKIISADYPDDLVYEFKKLIEREFPSDADGYRKRIEGKVFVIEMIDTD